MKAICLIDDGASTRVVEEERPKPEPGPGELLIRVHAAGVTTTELGWYPTLHTQSGKERQFPIPGHEFSGVIVSIGMGVTEAQIGDAIYGMNDWFQDGAMAEYCLTKPSSVALKPPSLTHAEAASVPIGALTAWQGLFDVAKLQAAERVLVQGGAGAVGVYAVQLARYRGAHIVSTAAPNNFDFVRELGAEAIIDYKSPYFSDLAGSFDVVFDVIGGDTLEKSWSLLKPSGRMVTIASQSECETNERVKRAFFIVEPNRRRLLETSDLLTGGQMRTVVDTIVPLADAPDAYSGRLAARRGRGKVVVEIVGGEQG
jgi:NADPH:quinone reductase-like Zn-dependent oxidoreductase